jgi:hypothetical protein
MPTLSCSFRPTLSSDDKGIAGFQRGQYPEPVIYFYLVPGIFYNFRI